LLGKGSLIGATVKPVRQGDVEAGGLRKPGKRSCFSEYP